MSTELATLTIYRHVRRLALDETCANHMRAVPALRYARGITARLLAEAQLSPAIISRICQH